LNKEIDRYFYGGLYGWLDGCRAGSGLGQLGVDTAGLVLHLAGPITQVLAEIHGQGASAAAETVALGAELAGVALLTVEGLVVGVHVDRVQALVAQVALETDLMPLETPGQHLLGRVDRAVALQTDVGHGF